MRQDAPDYTLLSDVNVIGSVTIDVNVVGSVTLNVYVTNAHLDVHVTESVTINVSVVNAVLNVNVTNALLDVRIMESATINVTVTNAYLDVRVKESITLNVNVTNAYLDVRVTESVTLNVYVTNAYMDVRVKESVTVNVNIVSSQVTFNVNITNPALPVGQVKPCLAFNGVNSYIEVPKTASVKGLSQITLEVIYVPKRLGVAQQIYIESISTDCVARLGLSQDSANRIILGGRAPDTDPGTIWVVSDITVEIGKCYHIFAIFNADTDVHKLVINGVVKTNTVVEPPFDNTDPYVPINIGRHSCGYYYGCYDLILVRLYNRELSTDEINWNMNNPYSPVTRGLLLWYRFDEGAGTTVYDYSGRRNHGTIYNAIWASSEGRVPALVNVSITASQVTVPVDIKASTATVPIRITASDITLNVSIVSSTRININIETQAIDLKIFTPSGRWVTLSELLPKFTERQSGSLPAATETTVKTVTGRGRLRTLAFWIMDIGTAFDIANRIRIRVYVDGVLRFECSLIGVDSMSGYPVDYIRMALQHHLATGLAMPFNTARYATSPDRYIIAPPHLSPLGGVTMAIWDNTNGRYRMMAGYINLEMEFISSLKIAIYNADTAYSAQYVVSYDIGEYP